MYPKIKWNYFNERQQGESEVSASVEGGVGGLRGIAATAFALWLLLQIESQSMAFGFIQYKQPGLDVVVYGSGCFTHPHSSGANQREHKGRRRNDSSKSTVVAVIIIIIF